VLNVVLIQRRNKYMGDLTDRSDYENALESTINAARYQNTDLSLTAWNLVAETASQQVARKETDEYAKPMAVEVGVGAVVGGVVGGYLGLLPGAYIGANVGGCIGVGVAAAFGPSEKDLELEMPNDVKDTITAIRAGKTYYGHE
jgi:hypothetical protein